jgi:hypothetical protein
MKRVVCPSAVRNVNTSREHQNDQVCTKGLPTFLGGQYSESSDFFNTNEDNVASLPNLEDMCQKEAPPIGLSSWRGNECNFLNLEGVFFAKGCVMTCNPRETILDNILGHDHVGLTILYYPGGISMIMINWKWSLA